MQKYLKLKKMYIEQKAGHIEGMGTYGTVFSSPRLPHIDETDITVVLDSNEVSKCYKSFEDYSKEVDECEKAKSILQNIENVDDYFIMHIKYGTINKKLVEKNRLTVYTSGWGYFSYKNHINYHITFPKGTPLDRITPSAYLLYISRSVLNALQLFKKEDLYLPDMKFGNMVESNRRIKFIDFGLIKKISDVNSTDFLSPILSNLYYICNPVDYQLLMYYSTVETSMTLDTFIKRNIFVDGYFSGKGLGDGILIVHQRYIERFCTSITFNHISKLHVW